MIKKDLCNKNEYKFDNFSPKPREKILCKT